MKRLIRKALTNRYDIDEKVRFVDKTKKGLYTIVGIDSRDNSYDLMDDFGQIIKNVSFDDILGENEFMIGDKVVYKNHPYDNTTVYEVKDILADGTYFIANEENGYTGINGKNLGLFQ